MSNQRFCGGVGHRHAYGVTLLEFAVTLALVGVMLLVLAQFRAYTEKSGGQSSEEEVRMAALRVASSLDAMGRLPAPRNMTLSGGKLVGEFDAGVFSGLSNNSIVYEVEPTLVSGPLPRRYSPNKLSESFGHADSPSAAISHISSEQRADLCVTLEDLVRNSFGKSGEEAAVVWLYERGANRATGMGWAATDFYTFADCPAVLSRLNATVDTWYTLQDHARQASMFVRMAEMDTRAAKYNLGNLSARIGIWSGAFLTGIGGTQEALSELHTSKLTGKAVFATIFKPSVLVSTLYAYGIGLTIYQLTKAAPAVKKAEESEQKTRDYLQQVQSEVRTAEQAILEAYTEGRTQ